MGAIPIVKEIGKTIRKGIRPNIDSTSIGKVGILDIQNNLTEPYKHLEEMSKSKFERGISASQLADGYFAGENVDNEVKSAFVKGLLYGIKNYSDLSDSSNDKNKKITVVASGYFNPLHKGHIEYLEKAKSLGDYLIVIVNNDKQRELKGSKKFMDEDERMEIVSSLKCVDEVRLSVDLDSSVSQTLAIIKPNIFAKGGDRYSSEIPESKICNELGIEIRDGLGNKIQSSSWLLENK